MAGEELLIADASERDREGLRKLFAGAGYICTAVADRPSAQALVQRKFFPVALIDMDLGGPSGGLGAVRLLREHSPPTAVVLLAGRRSFEAAVEALRLGVVDVVNKDPAEVQRLRQAVGRALDRYHADNPGGALLREVRAVLDESFKITLGLCRRLYAQQPPEASPVIKPAILLVDEDPTFLQMLTDALQELPLEVSTEQTGSSGLERATTFAFQIIVVREELTDLPGHMLLRSAQTQQPQTLGLLYSVRGPGSVQRYEQGHSSAEEAPFEGPMHLVRRVRQLVDEQQTMREERRYLQALRAEHGPFLKRFADLKARLDALGR